MKTGTNAVDQDHNNIIKDTTAKDAIIPTEAILGCTIGTADDITEVIHDIHTQILIFPILSMTLHIEGHLHIGAHQLTHGITADHAYRPAKKTLHQNLSTEDPKVIHTLEEI